MQQDEQAYMMPTQSMLSKLSEALAAVFARILPHGVQILHASSQFSPALPLDACFAVASSPIMLLVCERRSHSGECFWGQESNHIQR